MTYTFDGKQYIAVAAVPFFLWNSGMKGKNDEA
jgi:hypothetical protein